MTSIEWLLTWMTKHQYFIGNDLLNAFEEAEKMHKQEIMDAKKSIQFPSEEDIHIGIIEHCKIPHDRIYAEINAMIDGAKWIIDKIKNQQ